MPGQYGIRRPEEYGNQLRKLIENAPYKGYTLKEADLREKPGCPGIMPEGR